MTEQQIEAKRALMERVWEVQESLQRAASGDYSKRCSYSTSGGVEEDPIGQIAPFVNMLLDDLEGKDSEIKTRYDELQEKLETIQHQNEAIRQLSTPVLQLWESVIALPIIGVVDSRRAFDIMERLLAAVVESEARFVILDITGVEVVDTKTADQLIKIARATSLLGATCIVTGINPAVAQTLVSIGVDMSSVTTVRDLKEGLHVCMRMSEREKRR